MNTIVALPIAGAVATAAPSMAPAIADDLVGDVNKSNLAVSAPHDQTLSPARTAVERLRAATELFDRLYDQIDEARDAAVEMHGPRPIELIGWRNYSHIGGSEIEGTRMIFLAAGEDPATIGREYRDAKKRYRAIVKAGKDWDKRAGLDGLTNAFDDARTEMQEAEKALGAVKLRSIADASAVLDLLRARLEIFSLISIDWEIAALSNASKFLNRVTANSAALA